MKKYLYFLFCFISFNALSQEYYMFLVEATDKNNIPAFEKSEGYINYIGKNDLERTFYRNYTLVEFFQTFPDSERLRTQNIFTFVVNDENFGIDLINNFPDKFINFEDVTAFKVELTNSYPNDFGTTSPVQNLGVPHSLKSLDYVNAPKAWDITYGNSTIKIGISDSNINHTDLDFVNKTTLLPGYNSSTYSPPYSLNNESWHGTYVAGIAAAQGNNGHGMVGVCSNCSILATHYSYGGTSEFLQQYPDLNRLLQLKNAGAKVINMSWTAISPTRVNYSFYQWIFDELHDNNIVCVASSGNTNPYNAAYAAYNYVLYGYPASFDHVISVFSVNHKNAWGQQIQNYSGWGDVTLNAEDMIPIGVVMNYQGNGPYGWASPHTSNDAVDICAPGIEVFVYPWYQLNNSSGVYGTGTSGAAPHVSGTVGLMLSVYECLINDEAEDILKLTSKNLEIFQANSWFIGRSGSGKLETGDAVEFVSEMIDENGNALIQNQDFHRFKFSLKNINNKLTVQNQIFRDNNQSEFKAKNEIN
ncbi:MAG: S8/S53 family peptidase, partial [Candidatus Paceibacterota bacterium]